MNLTIAAAAWSRELGELLEAAMRRDPCCTLATLERLVRSDRATLLRISDEAGELFGAIVLELERHDRGADGVIVAAAFARRTGWRYYAPILAELERRFHGVARIRVRTPSRGLVKMLMRRGYGVRLVELDKQLDAQPAPARRLTSAEAAALELPELDPRAFAGGRPRALAAACGPLYIRGGSSSRSATTQRDTRQALAEGAVGISGDSNVLNVLDAGAIGEAFDFAKASDQETHKTLAGVLNFAGGVFETGTKQVEQAYESAKGEATQKTLFAGAALAAVAIVAIKGFAK